MQLEDRLAGTLVGTALGDALGLVAEGMSAATIERRFKRLDDFRFFGQTGFVSDDTEQSVLVAHALLGADSPDELVRRFRRLLLGWFLRLPWGLGLATLRACVRIALGVRGSGVYSAGNGAAMRAAVLGVYFRDAPGLRLEYGTALAAITHTDPRAVQGALMVAEVAAACARSDLNQSRLDVVESSLCVVKAPDLRMALQRAVQLVHQERSVLQASEDLGNTGFILHTLPLATFVFLRFGGSPKEALVQAVAAGGDTDTIAAIVGAWVGSLHGMSALPQDLVSRLQRGPFGVGHLRALASALAMQFRGESPPTVRFAWPLATMRNLSLFPVALVQGIRAVVGL